MKTEPATRVVGAGFKPVRPLEACSGLFQSDLTLGGGGLLSRLAGYRYPLAGREGEQG
ncbi:MAG: hypothetical protein ACOYOS_05915 [Syntrophales bacterium]